MRVTLLACLLALGAWGCASGDIDDSDPGILARSAEDDIAADRYQLALDKLRILKNKYPYSKHSVDARLRIADVYYLQESYAEAAANYESFRDLHPKHEKTSYAMYRIGESFFMDAPSTVARDQSTVQKALDAFNAYLAKYPNDAQSPVAREKATEAKEILSDKELYIGNYYRRHDYYEAAKTRYKKILETYPETKAAQKAKEQLERLPTS